MKHLERKKESRPAHVLNPEVRACPRCGAKIVRSDHCSRCGYPQMRRSR